MSSLGLEIRNLSRTYEEKRVLESVSLTFEPGSFTLITGENGSGKSLLMKHLNGLIKPEEGEIFLDGERIHKNIRQTRQRVGLLFQNADTQIVGQTVEQDIAFGPENLRWNRSKIEESVQEILERMGLLSLRTRNPFTLSGGEKKRLCLGSLLVMNPDYLLLDEPFTALDLRGVETILERILEFHQRGGTVILISHDVEKVLAHVDRTVILQGGRVVFCGEPTESLARLSEYHVHRPWGESREIDSMSWLRQKREG